MSEDVTRAGLVGDGEVRDRLHDDLADAGLAVETLGGAGSTPAECDVLVAVGERAVAEAVTDGPGVPIVPVGTGPGLRSIPVDAVAELPRTITTSDWETERHVPLTVAVDDDLLGTAVFDVTLVTAEPARISEYELLADGERLGRSRADGIVITTPAGSTDYARRVDVPILAPGTGIALAWIAPFRTDPDHWVTDASTLEIHVERDTATIDLHVDAQVVRTVDVDDVIRVSSATPFDVAVLPISLGRYGDR